MSNATVIAKELSDKELKTESYQTHQYTAISEHSSVKGTPQAIREWLTLSAGAFHANHSPKLETDLEPTIPETCGLQQLTPYAQLDPTTASLKTFQVCLLPGISSESFAILPKAGIACDGVVYRQPKWERRINEIGSGLLPTPTVGMVTGGQNPEKGGQMGLQYMARKGLLQMWPTPTARDSRSRGPSEAQRKSPALNHVATEGIGGQLNPTWVEWLMGWPLGWTDLKPLEMDRFQLWQRQHGICSQVKSND